MATFTFNHPDLLEKTVKEIFFKNYTGIELLFPKAFHRQNSVRAYEDGMRVAGFGTLATKAEGTPVAFDDPVSAAIVRTVHTVYALGFRITQEMADDDQEGIMTQMPADLGDAARDHMERLAWSVYNDAFAGATFTGLIDGAAAVSLCNATHTNLKTGTTQSNVLTPPVALSTTGLEDLRSRASLITSEEDRFININQSMLVYHPNLQHTANTLLDTQFRVGTSMNDVSQVSTSQSGITPLSRTGVPYLTSTTAWWLIAPPDRNSPIWNDRKKLEFKSAPDADSFDQKFYATYRASPMVQEWRNTYGSNA